MEDFAVYWIGFFMGAASLFALMKLFEARRKSLALRGEER
jgi:hypothetical protein